ncbi:MAG: hypothetical protein ACE37F_35935 [Nannocystaceae bacterium]|nr:hypothetical protein [bacterium]
MYPHQQHPHPGPYQHPQPATPKPAAKVGTIIALVFGGLFATCGVCGGIASLTDPEADRTASSAPANRAGIPERPPASAGALTTPECEAALRNVDRLLPGAGQGAPAGACRDAPTWDDPEEWRCAAKAERLAELQLCGRYWMTLVATYMDKQPASLAGPSPTGGVGADLGIGNAGRKRLATVAKAYGVTVRQVGDKAAKASELCLGGMEAVASNPALAVRKVEGALEFAAGVAGNEATRTAMPLDDLFVAYVTMECPDPS